jgi:hypothetical protein
VHIFAAEKPSFLDGGSSVLPAGFPEVHVPILRQRGVIFGKPVRV